MNEVESASKDEPTDRTPAGWHQYWQSEMDSAAKRIRKYTKQGNEVVKRYLDERSGSSSASTTRLNLFHTNISTQEAMLYGSTPKIDVAREHNDPDDDIARVAAMLYQRILEADIEPSGEDLSTILKSALQDRLLPGMGIARVRYDIETETSTVIDMETGERTEQEVLVSEDAPIEYVNWQDVLWGWGRTWAEVPWWAFRSYLTKGEATKRFGAEKAELLDYREQMPEGSENQEQSTNSDQKSSGSKAEVWEIWCETERRAFWHSKGADVILDARDDPLGLDGFFPIPRPMMANTTTTLFTPKADFVINQDLYNEIDTLQSRIHTITRAVKVVGVYDKKATGVKRMLQEGCENELIAVDNWAMFAEAGGLNGSVDWFPTAEVVSSLQTLVGLRDQAIDNLYQVTGMSDILRGANTDQYTSDGTNQLKAKFGSIRIQALQDEFARFASDLEALKAEVVSKHFSPASIHKQSNAQFVPQADLDKVGPAIQLMQSQDVKWRVNIKPESIAMVDYAQLKSERTEYLTAMATFMQSGQAVAKEMPGSIPILLEMMKWGMAGFKGSDYLEGTMDKAIELANNAPPPGQDDGKAQEGQVKLQLEQMKQQTAQMKIQGDIQKIQIKAQADMKTLQGKLLGEIQKIQVDAERDMALEDRQSQYALLEIARDLESTMMEIGANTESALAIEREQARLDMGINTQEHQHTMTEIGANARGNDNG